MKCHQYLLHYENLIYEHIRTDTIIVLTTDFGKVQSFMFCIGMKT